MALSESVEEIVGNSSNPLLSIDSSWERVNLGEIADVINGFAFKSAQFSLVGGTPLIRIRDVGANQTQTTYIGEFETKYIVEPGDLIIGMDGDFNCARWEGPTGLLNQRVCKVVLTSSLYDDRFLDYVLPGYLKAINEKTSSVTVKHLSSKTVREIPLPLPPLSAQIKIARRLDELLSNLEVGMGNIIGAEDKLKAYKSSVLKAACEGRLVPTEAELARKEGREYEPASVLLERILAERRKQWEEQEWAKLIDRAKQKAARAARKAAGDPLKKGEKLDPAEWQDLPESAYNRYLTKDDKWKQKYKEPEPPDTSDLPELPEGWVWSSIEQIGLVQTGATPKRGELRYWGKGTIPWITSGQVNEAKIMQANEYITKNAISETNTKVIPAGALVVAMYGEGKTRGKVSELGIDATTNQACATITFDKTAIASREYVKLFLEWNYVDLRQKASGGVQPNLNLSIIRSLPIAFPPIGEQLRITDEAMVRLSNVAVLSRSLQEETIKARSLRRAILEQAFTGKLVPQDAEDEPARILLERIRAQREAANS